MSDQLTFGFDPETIRNSQKKRPVTCLGTTYENDEARRAHFIEELRKKLQDPNFRKIEGFPIGNDEDVLALSDPPFYTACPNPWINDFIEEWEAQKSEKPEGYHYHREPFAADVSEGKNDPIYNAHSYHTKVPHKAIMRYILHYTRPGDIVFDGFCGTGMTGVASQMCGDREVVMSLGYKVKSDGTILQEDVDEENKKTWKPFSKIGSRRTFLNDLSPAATFIAYNYNTPVDSDIFKRNALRILKEVTEECKWMYETRHSNGEKGYINYVVWSDVFTCPDCAGDIVFWDAAVDQDAGKIRDSFLCPHCDSLSSKRNLERTWETRFDTAINETVRQAKQIPVLINYSIPGKGGRYEKKPDKFDLELIQKIDTEGIPNWFPKNRLPDGFNTRQPINSHGTTHVHHFYTKRNLRVLSNFRSFGLDQWLPFNALTPRATKMHRIAASRIGGPKKGVGGATVGVINGTLYIPAISVEMNVLDQAKSRVEICCRSIRGSEDAILATQSSTDFSSMPDNSIDYIFVDPPFGGNLNYSELSFNWESWLKVLTNNLPEAVENSVQGKGSLEYRRLMTSCFKEAYRLLKPGRWMTIEFSNTKASVWNGIQNALIDSGFIVANVSALDKKQGSFKAVTTPTAVKQDLVISAYKPNDGFQERFLKEAQSDEGVWDFIRTHLNYLPVIKSQGALLQFVPERDPRILFDQMVSFYVRKGYPVPISSQDFQIGLSQRLIERDGMYFLPNQVAEYDHKKMNSGQLKQMSLFVSDEASAIQWLRQLIKEKPQITSDINTQFMQKLGGWSRNEAQLDLRELLNQNFLCYDGKGKIPAQIVSWMRRSSELRPIIEQELQRQGVEIEGNLDLKTDNMTLISRAQSRWYVPDPRRAGDLEKLRERALLREFEEYKQVKKKLKVFRLEAVRAGFKNLWQQRSPEAYKVIIEVARKIPANILEEDPKLLMWYDQAITRSGGEN